MSVSTAPRPAAKAPKATKPASVLYDAPGPKARRRAFAGGLVATVLIAAAIGYALWRLAEGDQFSAERWGPLVDPSNETFTQVWTLVFRGLRATLTAASLAIVFSLVLGTLLGIGRMMLGRWGRIPLVGAMELLRGLPVVITIYFASRVLPDLGVDLSGLPGEDGLWYLVIGLTAYNMVIIAEILRAGVASLPRGQREAGLAVGLTQGQTMRIVLLPQAMRAMLPALISQIIVILKDTSLAAVLGIYTELLRQANLIAQNLDNRIPMLFTVGVIFILINYALSRLAVWTEKHMSRNRSAGAPTQTDASTPGPVGGMITGD